MVWKGFFESHLLCIVSTIRLTGHYIDLRVLSRKNLTEVQLRHIGELARTDETRPVAVRQGRQQLDQAVWITEAK